MRHTVKAIITSKLLVISLKITVSRGFKKNDPKMLKQTLLFLFFLMEYFRGDFHGYIFRNISMIGRKRGGNAQFEPINR